MKRARPRGRFHIICVPLNARPFFFWRIRHVDLRFELEISVHDRDEWKKGMGGTLETNMMGVQGALYSLMKGRYRLVCQ